MSKAGLRPELGGHFKKSSNRVVELYENEKCAKFGGIRDSEYWGKVQSAGRNQDVCLNQVFKGISRRQEIHDRGITFNNCAKQVFDNFDSYSGILL